MVSGGWRNNPWQLFHTTENFALVVALREGGTTIALSSTTVFWRLSKLPRAFRENERQNWYLNVKIAFHTRSGNGRENISLCCWYTLTLCKNNRVKQVGGVVVSKNFLGWISVRKSKNKWNEKLFLFAPFDSETTLIRFWKVFNVFMIVSRAWKNEKLFFIVLLVIN